MENLYHSISKAINIDANRKDYTQLYDFVRKSIIDGLKENEIFKKLFKDLSLGGSYADNLKISEPNEFDLVVRLELPYHDCVLLEEDTLYEGNVYLNITDVINKVNNQWIKNEPMLKFLTNVSSTNGYLLQDKFQSWFEGILTRYLLKIDNMLCNNGELVLLRYVKQGPAHTIEVEMGNCEISIDFVPGFRFSQSKSISPMKHLIENRDSWEAIPKPIQGRKYNPSFQCSYTESERRLLTGRNQFKNALRMMKKFRDMNPALVHLKSYFIKTLFLWHNMSMDQRYWNNSNETIMDVMFAVLEDALERREILFFWDERFNMLRRRSSEYQIERMYYEVRNARKILSKRQDLTSYDLQKIKNLFLTQREQNALPSELKKEIENNFWSIAKNAISSVVSQAPIILTGLIGVFLFNAIFRRE